MSFLLRLPPETLMQIMDHLGSSYFREDLGRLTVCKQWFTFARTVCFMDLQLSQNNLQRWLSSSRDVDMRRSSLLLMKNSAENLDLKLKGFDNWINMPEIYLLSPDADGNIPDWRNSKDGDIEHDIAAWTQCLDDDLAQLAVIVGECRKLSTLRIQASNEWQPLTPGQTPHRRDYLSLPTIRAFLSVKNLTVLELDLWASNLVKAHHAEQEHPDDSHICPNIGALLGTLRRLRLRMRSICPDALRPPLPHRETGLRLCLSEVLVNLSLLNESIWRSFSTTQATRCVQNTGEEEALGLESNIKDQAAALAACMASPKIVRVLTCALPDFSVRSWDALTGKTTILDNDMAWEDDGTPVDEDSSDSESEISDLSSF